MHKSRRLSSSTSPFHSTRGLVILSMSLWSGIAHAGNLEWRGFLTTGASVSDSSVAYQGVTKRTSATNESYLGLNLSKDLTKEWRVAGQILGRAGQADSAAKVDWAFVTYEPDPSYEVTLGKQKIPIWMISEYIDVGRAYPWVIPPEEVYTLFSLKSFTGGSFAYHLNIGDAIVTLEPYSGDVVYESQPSAPTADTKLRASNMYGLAAEWKLDNTLVRAAYNQANWNLDLGLGRDYGERTLSVFSAGLKSEWEGFLLMAEFAAVKDRDEDHYQDKARSLRAGAGTLSDVDAIAALQQATLYSQKLSGSGYYTTLGKDFLDDYLLHLTYASVKRPDQEGLARDQSSLALGLNYDINTDMVVKGEVKHVMLPGGSQGLFATRTTRDEATIYRLSFSMVF